MTRKKPKKPNTIHGSPDAAPPATTGEESVPFERMTTQEVAADARRRIALVAERGAETGAVLIGQSLRQLRRTADLTIDATAAAAGVGRATVIRYEAGKIAKFGEAMKIVSAIERAAAEIPLERRTAIYAVLEQLQKNLQAWAGLKAAAREMAEIRRETASVEATGDALQGELDALTQKEDALKRGQRMEPGADVTAQHVASLITTLVDEYLIEEIRSLVKELPSVVDVHALMRTIRAFVASKRPKPPPG